MNRTWILALVLAAGCSSGYDSAALGVKYQPPRGVKLAEETAGTPKVARFDNGFEIRSVDAEPAPVDEAKLATLLATACEKAALRCGEMISSRTGSIGKREVARFTLKEGSERRLLYYMPAGKRFVVLTFSAPDSRYDALEIQVDRSLGSLLVR